MNQQSQAKIWRQAALGVVAVAWGTFGSIETPAVAADETIILAQVRVRGAAPPVTSIRLRSRTHTPLPSRDDIQYYDYYGNPVYHNSRRGHRRFRSFRRHSRFGRHGRDRFLHRRRSRFRHRRHRRGFGTVIIKKKF